MPLNQSYVIARNRLGRPTLQHKVDVRNGLPCTACGVDIQEWSRAYSDKAIEAILCKKEACRA